MTFSRRRLRFHVVIVTKYVLLIVGSLMLIGGFAALVLSPDLRVHVQQRAPAWTSLIVLVCVAYAIYHFWSLRRRK